jgi:hypothetical protein
MEVPVPYDAFEQFAGIGNVRGIPDSQGPYTLVRKVG